jgi:transcription elongation factor Elf1
VNKKRKEQKQQKQTMETPKTFTTPRCCGLLSSGNPCLRKRQHKEYCTYHFKASQYTVLHLLEVNGVLHFVDHNNAVYDTEEIVMKHPTPHIIGHCTKIGEALVML